MNCQPFKGDPMSVAFYHDRRGPVCSPQKKPAPCMNWTFPNFFLCRGGDSCWIPDLPLTQSKATEPLLETRATALFWGESRGKKETSMEVLALKKHSDLPPSYIIFLCGCHWIHLIFCSKVRLWNAKKPSQDDILKVTRQSQKLLPSAYLKLGDAAFEA